MIKSERLKSWGVLAGLVILCAAVGAIGGAITVPQVPTWYAGLNQPSFRPPDWLFGPVWTTLYAMMAIAAWLAWRTAGPARRAGAMGLFLLQLAVNAVWPPIFFGAHLLLVGLIDIVLLWLALAATIVKFWRIRPVAGLLLLPYLAWVSFASVLNAAIWRLNP
jgi:tryptophan-rich sensory protein